MIIPQNQWKTNFCHQTQYFRKRPSVHTSWAERYTCLLVKKIAFMSSTEMIIPFRIIFLRLRHEKRCILWNSFLGCRYVMEKMRNLFLRSQYFKKMFSTKSKKEDTIYMGIIYMSFLSRNLLCKNIYTMSSFMWSNELFSILKWWLYLHCIVFFIQFFNTWSQLLKNMNFFRRNAKFTFAIGFQTIFRVTDFCDWLIQNYILRIKLLRFWAKITKISSAIIYSRTIYDHKNFCP